jgi:hypothetical protein
MSFVIYSVYEYARFLQMKKLLQDVYYSSRLKLRNKTFVQKRSKALDISQKTVLTCLPSSRALYITENSSYFFAIIKGFTKCVIYRNKKVIESF